MISRQTNEHRGRAGQARLRALMLLGAALGFAVLAAATARPEQLTRVLVAIGAALLVVLAVIRIGAGLRRRARDRWIGSCVPMVDNDSAPGFVTDATGALLHWNDAAQKRFPDSIGGTLAETLRAVFANPSAVLFRLQTRAQGEAGSVGAGGASEDIVTRHGHVRIAVNDLGKALMVWRVEDLPDRAQPGRSAENLPVAMMTAGRTGAILFMNDAARALTGGRVKTLAAMFDDLPVRSGEVNQLTGPGGPRDILVVERRATAGRTEMFLFPLRPGAPGRSPDFDALPVPLMKVAVSGEILAVNGLAQSLLGDPARTGRELSEVMQGLGRPIGDWLRDTAAGKPVHQSEFLRLNRRDREVFVQVTLGRVSEEGKTVLIAVLNDATELKTLEAQFVQSQKMQAIGQLAGGVAHDFNNLLTAISGHCDLLLLRHDQGDPDYGDLMQVHQNANRAAALVGQLLAFSRKQTLRPEVIDLRDTLSDLTHLLNRLVGEKVTLTLSHDPVLRAIRADKRQLEQVLMNLVVNARDAMPGGGEIRIDTEVIELREELCRDRATVAPGTYVTVRVCDQGVGIDPDKRQKVFEPFYTTKRTGEGTGLGLSTAYGIVKQTGGFIFVDSAPGEGTCFTLYFPVHDEVEKPRIPPPAPISHAAIRHGDGVVLLVEDEAPVRAFASRALRMRGYTVLEAGSAEEALAMLDDPGLNVDVFVTDVVMPGMDGPSWVREALVARPDARVVFVSGYAEGAFGDSGPTVPNSVFLSKPFSLNQLTETVHRQLH